MVVDRLADGTRIAQLLASELTGHEAAFAMLSVVDADPDVEPTDDGAFAYAVAANDTRVAEVYVQPDRARIEFVSHPDVTAEAAGEQGLRVRPKAVRPPRTLVFVEDGAQVKWTLPAFRALVAALEADGADGTGEDSDTDHAETA
ncbi:hypothetical protein GJR96_08290 [Haloferax sp. MBLA0076]|uniref:DUF7993 domain-containing protein n=1 Tax=Haloferax litoreum TaxID=2666140 RepID=A0A6A8GEY1_9EURY|nr:MULTISPECIES: hypothetical protein [Haloferax]KAB1193443.1 hypothetical protein Hfx1148_08285 [Haloferax sp. CBA1148]MRX21954.1 hypothetical protein [Haloferax litoreum]